MSGSNPVPPTDTRRPRRRPIIAAAPGNLGAAAAAASWKAAVCPSPRGPGSSRFRRTAHRSAGPRSALTLKEVA
jgi:hypothetical protein